MIDFLPHDITPTSPATWIQENFEAIEAALPWDEDFQGEICSCNINWADGCIVPIDNLPIDDIRDALSDSTNATFSTDFGFVGSGLLIQYRDDLNVYAFPGQVMHRGVFKRQPFDDTTGKVRVVLASAVLNNPAADGDPGTTSGLKADEWYYWYAKLDTATGYPDYRVTLVAPTNEDGYGLEHPTDTGMRYLGVMATGNAPDAYIVPFYRGRDGWFFYREVDIGPFSPDADLDPGGTAGFIQVPNVENFVPPSADWALFLIRGNNADPPDQARLRTLGDSGDDGYSFGAGGGNRWSVVSRIPINTMDPATDEPEGVTTFELKDENDLVLTLSIGGFREPIFD